MKKRAIAKVWLDPLKDGESALAIAQGEFNKAQDELKKHANKENANKEEQDKLAKEVKRLDEIVKIAKAKVEHLIEQRDFYDKQPQRYERLLQVLEELPARIRLRVYYELGDGDDEAMQVRLAETKDD